MNVVDESRIRAIVDALSDEYCRKILSVTSQLGKTPEQITSELSIPISTCYRRIHDLSNQSILRISKIELANGRKLVYYKSTYKCLELKFDSGGLVIEATLNTLTPEEQLASMISEMRIQRPTIHDCDLCQEHETSCKILKVGESKTQVFVCISCEARVGRGDVPTNMPAFGKVNTKPKQMDDRVVEFTA
jgi:hypothetical protein